MAKEKLVDVGTCHKCGEGGMLYKVKGDWYCCYCQHDVKVRMEAGRNYMFKKLCETEEERKMVTDKRLDELEEFGKGIDKIKIHMKDDDGESRTIFESGAQRAPKENHPAYSAISPCAIRRLAQTHSEGDARYGEYNWEKGIPARNLIDHCLDHVFYYLQGDRGEDHLAHATWNLMALMHMEENNPDMLEGLRKAK